MYDPSWPHGHTWKGTPCRVLADDIVRTIDNYTLAIVLPNPGGDSEYVANARPEDLMPAPVPKKRIQGWTAIHTSGQVGPLLRETLAEAKALYHWFDVVAYVYIDAEEGEGLEQRT